MKKGYAAVSLFALAAGFAHVALAEGGCPAGQYPQQGQGWKTCVPIPDSQDAKPGYTPVWEDRWQAVATDSVAPILGKSVNVLSERIATDEAIADCERQGGTQCKVDITAANGCVSVVVGTKGTNFKAAKTKTEAETAGLKLCNSEDSNCNVYYSSCSQAVRVL